MSYTKTGVRCDADTVTEDDILHLQAQAQSRTSKETKATIEICQYALHGALPHVRRLCREWAAELTNIGNGIFDD